MDAFRIRIKGFVIRRCRVKADRTVRALIVRFPLLRYLQTDNMIFLPSFWHLTMSASMLGQRSSVTPSVSFSKPGYADVLQLQWKEKSKAGYPLVEK